MESDDSSKDDLDESERNIEGKFHKHFVSGWDDDNEGIEDENERPSDSPEKEILWCAEHGLVERVCELLVKDCSLARVRDKDGYTPLHRAAYSNNLDVLNVLLGYDADYNAETNDKWTPLHSACHWNSAACVEKLLSLDLNVNVQSEGGITPLHLASSNSSSGETVLILLLHPNIDTSLKNNSDETAYEIAVRKGRLGRLFELTEPCFNYI